MHNGMSCYFPYWDTQDTVHSNNNRADTAKLDSIGPSEEIRSPKMRPRQGYVNDTTVFLNVNNVDESLNSEDAGYVTQFENIVGCGRLLQYSKIEAL